jgi:hypothetical protein
MKPPRIFFVHVMKTAGTSLVNQLKRHYPPERQYPGSSEFATEYGKKSSVTPLLEASKDEVDAIELFTPHVPAVAVSATSFDGFSCTVLREPVSRSVSHLAQLVRVYERHNGRQVDPRRIWEHDGARTALLSNHQLRVFGLGRGEEGDWTSTIALRLFLAEIIDNPTLRVDPLVMDERRLEFAMQTLESIGLVGVTEGLARFTTQLNEITGFSLNPDERWNVGPELDLDPALFDEIVMANELERPLYERACELAGVAPAPVGGTSSPSFTTTNG